MRNRTRTRVGELLRQVRYEVLPTEAVVDDVSAHLPAGATVTVTASPSKGLSATLDCATALAERGFDVVPHLAARMISGPGELSDIVERLAHAGVRSLFVPAGERTPSMAATRDRSNCCRTWRRSAIPLPTSASPATRSHTPSSVTM